MKFVVIIKTLLKVAAAAIVAFNLSTINVENNNNTYIEDTESMVETIDIETVDIKSEITEPLFESEMIDTEVPMSVIEETVEIETETVEIEISVDTEVPMPIIEEIVEETEEVTTTKVIAETVEDVKAAFASVSYYDPNEMYKVEPGCGYTSEDLEYLSKIMWNEAGSYWITDEQQMMFGQVVLNRVNAPVQFPDTIKEVALAPNQYDCDFENITPDKRAIDNARKLLSGEYVVDMPHTVVFQANFPQGSSTWMELEIDHLGSTYFCHAYYIEYYQ